MPTSLYRNRRRPLRFCTLHGVEDVRLLKGNIIAGRWCEFPPLRGVGRQLIKDFANWSARPDDVSRFTEEYGPISEPAVGGREFSFSVDVWAELQRSFRLDWERLVLKPRGRAYLVLRNKLPVERGEGFLWLNRDFAYRTSTLYRLLLFELYSVPREDLRKCARPNCPKPYFVAKHGSQRYCSPPCADWAQKKEKREWWAEERRRRKAEKEKKAAQKRARKASTKRR